MRKQRGESDGGMLLLVITLWVFLFWGDPDPWDKLHAYVMSIQPIGRCDS